MKIKKLTAAAIIAAMVTTALSLSSVPTIAAGVAANSEETDAKTEGDWQYEIYEDGETISLLKYNGSDTVVDIPATLSGKTVTGIAPFAFQSCTSITSITIPESVWRLGISAFEGCTSLTSITLPYGVDWVGNYAFKGCTSLTSIDIPNSVKAIEVDAFKDCTSLSSITVPDSVTKIDNRAFDGCTSLKTITVEEGNADYTSIDGVLFKKDNAELAFVCYPAGRGDKSYTIPEGVTKVEAGACSQFTSVTLPKSMATINYSAFNGCKSLTSITIPDSVTEIQQQAFYYCTSLTNITIPNSVTKIETSAFDQCISLTSITLPDSLTEIGMGAFLKCPSLTSVYYSGSAEQWEKIEIDYGNDSLENATIHYNCAPINDTDKATGINTNGILPNGAKLSVTPIKEQTTETQYAYDLSFTDANGKEVQPESDVTVKIPVPEAFKDKKFYVYHVLNGKNIPIEYIVEDSMIVFSADHFSTFIISEKQLSETEEQPNDPDSVTPGGSDKTSDKNSGAANGNDQANTGIALATAPVIMAACAAVVIFKKKRF